MEANWSEYDSAAEYCAKRGIPGNPGDALPHNLSGAAHALINADPEAFARRVREYAYTIAMEKHSDSTL